MTGGRVWVVSELYYPEETSTGYLLTRIAEGIARQRPVTALCAQPSYAARGTEAPAREVRHGVEIRRCPSTTFNKDRLALRLVNVATVSLSIFVHALAGFRRGDCVLVVTNPPALPFLVAFAARLRGARSMLLIHDVYPDVLTAAGMSREPSALTRFIGWATRRLYSAVDRIVVLGRDMQDLVWTRLRRRDDKVVIITNWADVDDIRPLGRGESRLLRDQGLTDKFVVQYAGNMGRTHGLEDVVQSARLLRARPDVHLLFIGSGAKRAWVERQAREEGLENVTVLGNRPRSEQPDFLNACDVAIISFVTGMAGISVPSRMYNILAAGKPIVAVADAHSELALVVREERVGWVVPPGNAQAIADAILEARSDPGRLREMSERARAAAERKYAEPTVLASYAALIRQLSSDAA